MDHPIRSDVRVALCETHPALRSGFQTALYRRGLRGIEVCKDSGALITLLQNEIVDLVICATDLPGLDFYDLIQQIRHGAIGRNPFTLVLATVSEATLDQVRQIMNAGVDRVAVKPMSMADMIACVNSLAVSRKPFVATDSYVGPSRRGTARPDHSGDEAMDAPNTLQAKMAGAVGEARLERLIDAGQLAVDRLRSQTACLAVARSVRRVALQVRRKGPASVGRELSRLRSLSEALGNRYRGASDNHLGDVANSLIRLAELLARLPPHQERLLPIAIGLLEKLGEVVRLLGRGDAHAAETVRAVAQSVQSFTAGLSREAEFLGTLH